MTDYLGNIKIIHDLNSKVLFECQFCNGSQSGYANVFPVCDKCKKAIRKLIKKNKNGVGRI